MFSEKELKEKRIDNICVLFPYELSWGKNHPIGTVSRIEWLFENFNGKVTIIEPYIRKEYQPFCPFWQDSFYCHSGKLPFFSSIFFRENCPQKWAEIFACYATCLFYPTSQLWSGVFVGDNKDSGQKDDRLLFC